MVRIRENTSNISIQAASSWPLFVLMMTIFMFTFPSDVSASWFDNRPVIGWVENVGLDEADTVLKARIDTGAGLASINAQIVEIKHGSGDDAERVVFRVVDKDGKSKTLERPVVDWINIKKKGDSGAIRRPVVKLDFCLGGKKVEARANLADRTGFLYPVLIGRNVLKTGDYIIDPKQKFTHEPGCK